MSRPDRLHCEAFDLIGKTYLDMAHLAFKVSRTIAKDHVHLAKWDRLHERYVTMKRILSEYVLKNELQLLDEAFPANEYLDDGEPASDEYCQFMVDTMTKVTSAPPPTITPTKVQVAFMNLLPDGKPKHTDLTTASAVEDDEQPPEFVPRSPPTP